MEVETMRDEKQQPRREPAPSGRARTCVGCRALIVRSDAEDSFRVVLVPGEDGRHEVAVDLAGGSFGRGAHVHASTSCVAKACTGGFSRAFKCQVAKDPRALAQNLREAADRRVEGLLLGARRAGLISFGEDAKRAMEGGAPLAIVACDAGSSATGGPLRQAVAEGRVVVWRTKVELGSLFSRELVALVTVRHEAVAREIRRARNLSESVGQNAAG